MKNKFLIIFVLTFCQITNLLAESLNITSKNISVDKKSEVTIFENEVLIKDTKNNTIQSEYAEYNKKLNLITLKKNVLAKDSKGNIFESDDAEYNEKLKVFRSIGETKITTKEGSTVNTKNITLNNLQNIVYSNDDTIITDIQKNKILLNNFEYKANEGIFKSVGKIKVVDNLKNSYEFSQIYIDEKNKEIVGSDAKLYVNQPDFKLNKKNKPRVFSNTINISNDKSKFIKSSFTMCDYREKDKCPHGN